MAKIASIFGVLEKLENPHITVHQDRCVLVRNRNASCRRCADACTSQAISLIEGELVISPDLCIGCGTCATVCPTCALEAHRPSDGELLSLCFDATKVAEGEVVIGCEKALKENKGLYDLEKVVAVTCLGRAEESLLIMLVAQGARRISLVKGRCAQCEYAVGITTAELVKSTVNVLMETWGQDVAVEIIDEIPSSVCMKDEAEYDYDRRAFFSSVKKDAQIAAAKTVTYAADEALGVEAEAEPKHVKVMRDGTLPHFIPMRRGRLLKSLAMLGVPQNELIETRLWGHVIIDVDLCNSCRMCATFCPTGALFKFSEADGSFGVEHLPSACVKCRCCVDICPECAITISDEVFAVDLLDGATERYRMKPMKNSPWGKDAIVRRMKSLLGSEQISGY